MNFTSNIFIYVFMPFFVLLYIMSSILLQHFNALKNIRLPDMLTIAAGFVFYIWACVDNIVYLIALIAVTYLLGKIICHTRSLSVRDSVCRIISVLKNTSFALVVVGVGIVAAVFILYRFKYDGQILLSTWNIKSMSMPLGISFLTFSVISYLVDVYKGADPGTLMDVALYISFFPKVISGPIVLWENFKEQLQNRILTVDNMEQGILRIIYGLSKKVILADYFGSEIALIQNNSGGGVLTHQQAG